jgi:hypothetical protein
MYFDLDGALLDTARAACVALPAAGLPLGLDRLRSRGWALVAPLSIVVVAVLLTVWSPGGRVIAWTALILVPLGCALALGWAAHGARPAAAVLAAPLLAVAVAAPGTTIGDLARIALIAGAAVTAARLLAGSGPIPLLKVGLVVMAIVDATIIFGEFAQQQDVRFAAAVAAPGLPQLQVARLGNAGCDFADFFAAAFFGAILARERRPQLLAAVATLVATQAFDQLFLLVDELPATVPPALVMLALEARRRRQPRVNPRSRHGLTGRHDVGWPGRRQRRPESSSDHA